MPKIKVTMANSEQPGDLTADESEALLKSDDPGATRAKPVRDEFGKLVGLDFSGKKLAGNSALGLAKGKGVAKVSFVLDALTLFDVTAMAKAAGQPDLPADTSMDLLAAHLDHATEPHELMHIGAPWVETDGMTNVGMLGGTMLILKNQTTVDALTSLAGASTAKLVGTWDGNTIVAQEAPTNLSVGDWLTKHPSDKAPLMDESYRGYQVSAIADNTITVTPDINDYVAAEAGTVRLYKNAKGGASLDLKGGAAGTGKSNAFSIAGIDIHEATGWGFDDEDSQWGDGRTISLPPPQYLTGLEPQSPITVAAFWVALDPESAGALVMLQAMAQAFSFSPLTPLRTYEESSEKSYSV